MLHRTFFFEKRIMYQTAWWARFISWLIRRLVRFCVITGLLRLEIRGRQHWRELRGGVIVAPNQLSAIDGVLVNALLPREARFFVTMRIFATPWRGRYMAAAGHLPVLPGDPRLNARSFLDAQQVLRAGHLVGIFPEGRYSSTPRSKLWPFFEGAAKLALRTGAPVMPVGLRGTAGLFPWVEKANRPLWLQRWEARPGWSWLKVLHWWPRRSVVYIRYGQPLLSDSLADTAGNRQELTRQLIAAVSHLSGLEPSTIRPSIVRMSRP